MQSSAAGQLPPPMGQPPNLDLGQLGATSCSPLQLENHSLLPTASHQLAPDEEQETNCSETMTTNSPANEPAAHAQPDSPASEGAPRPLWSGRNRPATPRRAPGAAQLVLGAAEDCDRAVGGGNGDLEQLQMGGHHANLAPRGHTAGLPLGLQDSAGGQPLISFEDSDQPTGREPTGSAGSQLGLAMRPLGERPSSAGGQGGLRECSSSVWGRVEAGRTEGGLEQQQQQQQGENGDAQTELSSTTTIEFSIGPAPPSYKTATRHCATLDARQLRSMQLAEGQSLSNQQWKLQQPALNGNPNGSLSSKPLEVDYWASSTLNRPRGGPLEHLSAARLEASLGRSVGAEGRLLHQTQTQGRRSLVGAQLEGPSIDGSDVGLGVGAGLGLELALGHTMAAEGRTYAKENDNNQGKELPINHVISVCESIQRHQQQQQQQANNCNQEQQWAQLLLDHTARGGAPSGQNGANSALTISQASAADRMQPLQLHLRPFPSQTGCEQRAGQTAARLGRGAKPEAEEARPQTRTNECAEVVVLAAGSQTDAASGPHRKRRRQRNGSTAAARRANEWPEVAAVFGERPGVRPAANNGRPPIDHAGRPASSSLARKNGATISAHCWLIDSSDEAFEGAPVEGGASSMGAGRLTVAMMRQDLESGRRGAGEAGSSHILESSGPTSGLAWGRPGERQESSGSSPAGSEAADWRPAGAGSLTSSLKTNSLRLERILSRSAAEGPPAWERHSNRRGVAAAGSLDRVGAAASLRGAPSGSAVLAPHAARRDRVRPASLERRQQLHAGSGAEHPRRREHRDHRDHRAKRRSRSLGGRAGSHASAASLTRLSGLLAFVSSLVAGRSPSRAGRARSARSGGRLAQEEPAGGANKCLGGGRERRHGRPASRATGRASSALSEQPRLAGPQSVSGSAGAGGAPYAPPSSTLGISSSSSTSAYASGATNSSSLAAHPSRPAQAGGPLKSWSLLGAATKDPGPAYDSSQTMVALYNLRLGATGAHAASRGQPAAKQRPGAQLDSGAPGHCYEYCDSLGASSVVGGPLSVAAEAETCFVGARSSPSPDSGASSSSAPARPETGPHSDETATEAAAAVAAGGARLATPNQSSDHELLPSGSVARPARLRRASRHTLWSSLKFRLLSSTSRSRTGASEAANGSGSGTGPARWRHQWGAAQLAPARHRELRSDECPAALKAARSRTSSGDDTDGSLPSAAALSVMALVKADRQFRRRLLASVLVSLLLLGLICLLVGTIYRQHQVVGGKAHSGRRADRFSWLTGSLDTVSGGQLSGGKRVAPTSQQLLAMDRLNFMLAPDEADHDLSWLWQPSGSPQELETSRTKEELVAGEPKSITDPDEQPRAPHLDQSFQMEPAGPGLERGAAGSGANPAELAESSLRSLLQVIDRSDRLAQLQWCMAHLTNIQLATDQFLDLTRIAQKMFPPNWAPSENSSSASGPAGDLRDTSDPSEWSTSGDFGRPKSGKSGGIIHESPTETETETERGAHEEPHSQHNADSRPGRQAVTQAELDVAYLTLLSNLHWPLIKWRHQSASEQHGTTGSFFSFTHIIQALNPHHQQANVPLVGEGSQSIKNLLSSLLLVELAADLRALRATQWSSEPHKQSQAQTPMTNYVNHLMQYKLLHEILASVSHHLLTCSLTLDYLEGSMLSESHESHTQRRTKTTSRFLVLKENFCKLLVGRYRRTMLLLGEMDYSHLVELYERSETVVEQVPLHNFRNHAFNQRPAGTNRGKFSKNLLTFLLDRLGQLDVHLLAELTLAHFKMSSEEWRTLIAQQDDQPLEGPSAAESETVGGDKRLDNVLIEYILNDDFVIKTQRDSSSSKENNLTESHETKQLSEFLRELIGESPLSAANLQQFQLTGEELQEFRQSFETNYKERHELWLERLADDLLDPFGGSKVEQLSQVDGLNYELFLHPNLTNRLIIGMNKMEFRLERQFTRFLILNCAQLNLFEVELWLKESDLLPHNIEQKSEMKMIPIRRVVLAHKSEQLLIELLEPIVSAKETPSSRLANGVRAEKVDPMNLVNFGEAIPTITSSRGTHMSKENRFLLSISFNKTNLMPQSKRAAEALESGINFIEYADYFVQQSSEAEVKTMLMVGSEGAQHTARHLFPCFDSSIKQRARFQVNLVHDRQHEALMNSQKRERLPYNSDGSYQMSVFESTANPMDPNELALVIYDAQSFKIVNLRMPNLTTDEQSNGGGRSNHNKESKQVISVQILTQLDYFNQVELLHQLVPQLMSFYQLYFMGQVNRMNKLDLMAIPRQIWRRENAAPIYAGQMSSVQMGPNLDLKEPCDGWSNSRLTGQITRNGLITFRFSQYLVDQNSISQELLEQICLDLSERIARLYFGQEPSKLSSSRQSSNTLISKALVQYVAKQALESVHESWHLEEQFPSTSIGETIQDSERMVSLNSAQFPASIFSEMRPKWHQSSESPFTSGLPSSDLNWWLWPESGQESALVSANDQLAAQDDAKQNHRVAILHMLLLNLLPDRESRSRLLRRYVSLSSQPSGLHLGGLDLFWNLFDEQIHADTRGRQQLPLEWRHKVAGGELLRPMEPGDQETLEGGPEESMGERVVFIRRKSGARNKRKRNSAPIRQNGTRLAVVPGLEGHEVGKRRVQDEDLARRALPLAQIFAHWSERVPEVPLVHASWRGQKLVLRQESYALASDSSGSLAQRDELAGMRAPVVSITTEKLAIPGDKYSRFRRSVQEDHEDSLLWPIPLMYISRYNAQQARFFWFYEREMEIPLPSGSNLQNQADSSQFESQSSSILSKFTSSQTLRKLSPQYPWFKLNVNQSSLVRVNYDERNWEALTELLSKSHYSKHQLGPLDRANLLDDAHSLMRDDKLSVGVAMNLTLYLEVGEREFAPWTAILRHWDEMQTLLNQNPLWHRYVLRLLQPISTVIGWKDDGPHLMRKLRRQLFTVALQYGDEKIIAKSKQEFKQWLKNGRYIVPNLQELVYVSGLRYGGDQSDWFACWRKYQQLMTLDLQSQLVMVGPNKTILTGDQLSKLEHTARLDKTALAESQDRPPAGQLDGSFKGAADEITNNENEKRQLLTALASTENTWLLEQFLNYTLDSNQIQPHHLKHVIKTLGKNPVARLYLWRFVRLNWYTLQERYAVLRYDKLCSTNAIQPPNTDILETMIIESTKHFSTRLDLEEVETFFETRYRQFLKQVDEMDDEQRQFQIDWTSSVKRSIKFSLHTIKSNIFWRNTIEPKLTAWLQNYISAL